MFDSVWVLKFNSVKIRTLLSDLDLGGHRLQNVASEQCRAIAAETVEASSISVPRLSPNRLLYVNEDGKLASTNITIEDGVLVGNPIAPDSDADSESADTLIDMTNKTLVRPHLLSPEISDVLKLSVGTLQVMALRPGSLVGVDSSGSLESVLGVQIDGRKLAVDTLEVKEIASDVDMGGHVLKRSEEHTSELQSLMRISYAVFCLKKTK